MRSFLTKWFSQLFISNTTTPITNTLYIRGLFSQRLIDTITVDANMSIQQSYDYVHNLIKTKYPSQYRFLMICYK